ncbi:MAG TPA: PDZ domain-containing protein [Gemmatimonadales bacterium]|jgi:tricorn protease
MRRVVALVAAAVVVPIASAAAQVNARMLRYPDVSATQIVFVYAGDIWLVPKTGGAASRLSSPAGEETFPRFSPDGGQIAYSANYDGNQDVYVVPATGGPATRITHHPGVDRLIDWYPDGRSLLYATTMTSGTQRFDQFWKVSATGGMPERLAIPYGEFAAFSPDGRQVAYMPMSQDFRTWKRYRGGWSPDIWLFDLTTMSSENLTNNDANDAQPMWHGRKLYFLSDRDPAQRNNIWVMDLDTRQTHEVTHLTDYDITFPAIGPDDIVFQAGGRLYLLDLSNEQMHEVTVNVVTDFSTLRPRVVHAESTIVNYAISPLGQRAILEARGDLFTLPARYGNVTNLTQSSGVAERYPAYAPDGRRVAYWSDRTGEYELYLRPADDPGAERKVTSYGPGFRYRIFWSPDGHKVAFVDQAQSIHILDVESGQTADIDHALHWSEGNLEGFAPSWSGDSRWLAWSRDLTAGAAQAIFLYDTHSSRTTQVTSGYYNDQQPAFDPDGKYLYFLSNRTLNPIYSDLDNSWIYANTTNLVAVSLRRDVPSPLAPRNDADSARRDTTVVAPPNHAATPGRRGHPGPDTIVTRPKPPTPEAVEIDTAGFEQRLTVLPPPNGNYNNVHAVSGKVLYLHGPLAGSSEEHATLMFYDLKDREEKTILGDVDDYQVSNDGKRLLVRKERAYALIDLKEGAKFEHPLRVGEMLATVNPRAEWRQIFNDVWRIERDFFYDKNMHGVDWNVMRERYGRLIDDATTRWDVNFIIGELISELSSSHTYRGGGDIQAEAQLNVGLLGVDWALENGAFRIKHIVDGAPWDAEVRSPLARPGVNVHEDDYLLAVNGIPVDTAQDPWAAFAGLAGRTVELMVNDRPTVDGARRVLVETLRSESRLRNLAWIEMNRHHVDSATGGRVGYIYVPSTGLDGQTELVRQLEAQFTKEALIVDERFNSGGQIPDRFIELLNRPALVYWATRDGQPGQWPPVGHFGPKVMLINGWSGSGGDAFPFYFKEAHLGPLIGTRTWGGLIGISGNPPLVDGGNVTVPTFRQYDLQGHWFPEGHGVDPDILVVDDPTQLARGVDPQLERGIQEVMRLLAEHPFTPPTRPAPENRVPRP